MLEPSVDFSHIVKSWPQTNCFICLGIIVNEDTKSKLKQCFLGWEAAASVQLAGTREMRYFQLSSRLKRAFFEQENQGEGATTNPEAQSREWLFK